MNKFEGTHRYVNYDRGVCVFGDYAELKADSEQLFNNSRSLVRSLKHNPELVIDGWLHLGVVNKNRLSHVNVN